MDRIEPRDLNEMYRAFENADFYVRKKYRDELDQYGICDLPEQLVKGLRDDDSIGNNVQFFRIEKIVYDKAENNTDKLITVYNTLSSYPDTAIVLVLLADEDGAELYLGVAQRITQDMKIDIGSRGNKAKALKSSFEANFPGSVCNTNEKANASCALQANEIIQRAFDEVKTVSSVAGIAARRNRDQKENEQFVQGLEKLIDAMKGKKYTALFIADCKTADDIDAICTGYEDIYSCLYPFLQSVQTIGRTSGEAATNSFISGVTQTTNESIAKTNSTSHTLGKTSSDTVGASVTVGGNSGFFPGPSASVSANYSHSWGRSESDTKQEGKTTTQGSSKSLNEQNSVAKSITKATNEGVQITYQNRAVKTLLDVIDEQIKHLRLCEAYGVYDFGAYFLSEDSSVAETVASVYDSLMRGDESGAEISSVNTWRKESAERVIGYLKRLYHPLIAAPDLSQKVDKDGKFQIMPVTPSTIISGKELALQMPLPKKSVSGLPVSHCAEFGRNVVSLDNSHADESVHLGSIYHMQKAEQSPVTLDVGSLAMHTFITGSTGSGKSNTIYQLLSQLKNKIAIKFLVVEPAKGEYKNVFGDGGDVCVYGTNPQLTQLLRINPFSFPKEIHIYEHMDRLVEIFNVCWPMYAAMPAVLKDAVERAYVDAGWNLNTSTNKYDDRIFPTFADVLNQIDIVMNESQYSADSKGDYKGALSTRLKSLTNGINGMIFTSDEISGADLFDKNVIVDLSRVGSMETKSMIMGLLVVKLQEYRMTFGGMNQPLKHVTVLEEAHNLLKRTSTEQSTEGANLLGKSVEMLTNAIAEMCTYGEGFIIADQAPGLLDMAVIRNTNTKIVLRLPEQSDRELVGKAMGMNDDQISELAKLEKGVAAIYQNDWIESVLCKVEHFKNHETHYLKCDTDEKKWGDQIKGKIISNVLANRIYDMIEPIDKEMIIKSDLSSRTKCKLLSYCASDDNQKLSIVASVVFDLLGLGKVSAIINELKTADEQETFVRKYIMTELETLPKQYHEIFVCLALYEQAIITDNRETKFLANELLHDFGGRRVI